MDVAMHGEKWLVGFNKVAYCFAPDVDQAVRYIRIIDGNLIKRGIERSVVHEIERLFRVAFATKLREVSSDCGAPVAIVFER